jgi:PPOX class probable F420-dependent enzyme
VGEKRRYTAPHTHSTGRLVTTGSCDSLTELPPDAVAVLNEARRAVLATVSASGTPHAVPVCYALRGSGIVTAVDHKPKSGRPLARLRNVERTGSATLLVDRWSEDWDGLAWVMVHASARLDPPHTADDALARRYAQYRETPPSGPVIALVPRRVVWWTAS